MTNKSSDNENPKGLVSIVASFPLIRRIKIIKELFLEKLDVLNKKFNNFDNKVNLLLQNDTPLLQVSIAITKSLQSIQQEIQGLLDELRKNFAVSSIKLSEMDDKIIQLERKVEKSQQKLSSEFQALVDTVVKKLDSQITGIQQNDGLSNREVGLMCYLYSYLPSRRVIDIGANVGETSQSLLKVGYEVYAFEPFSSTFQELNERLGSNPNFHSFPFAIGEYNKGDLFHIACDQSEKGIHKYSSLYNSLAKNSMPDDLPFAETISVNVRSLVDLHDTQEIPSDIGLVKIDTEGYDIQVIRGMGSYRYPVVVAKFGDTQFSCDRFGAMNQLEELVQEMKTKNYNWYIVIYQVSGNNTPSFYSNYPQSVENSWGNVFFFQDYSIFSKALMWCSAVMSETYIQSVSDY
ncbi:FkbM family methyltransferase [Cyanothece sp. BG0011]|uniref:FkbM family methyltransferase n=1 Tax=Cyanothece sp. BG0011 TaxID=2082950 RepID=UPI0013009D99|nr:FkbM family methyltransferase [Cyanothece sp. BG0011]